MREVLLPHSNETLASRRAFEALSPPNRVCLIEFPKSLQLAPSQTTSLAVNKTASLNSSLTAPIRFLVLLRARHR